MKPTPALALGHGIACKQTSEERDTNQQVEHERWEVVLQRNGTRGGDVYHVVEGWQQKSGRVLSHVCAAGD